MNNICLLGSTGSIGQSALEVIANLRADFYPIALSCQKNIKLLQEQMTKFKPKYVCITELAGMSKFAPAEDVTLLSGLKGMQEIAAHPDVDILLNAIVGTTGLYPTLTAIRAGKRIAMANKETLVAYGEIIMKEVAQNEVILVPVDSEHSAIHQCIGSRKDEVKRIILTASGGPFLKKEITPETTLREVLTHPVWQMGAKITVDSATLMNKGLEVIEAAILFGIEPQRIEVVIHPQSIIHSAVEFVDGSIIAQMSSPDMKLSIQYALTYPERLPSLVKSIRFGEIKRLDFLSPDFKKFPCLKLAYEAAYAGGTMPCVLNAANEIAVESFLDNKIKLPDIPVVVREVTDKHSAVKLPTISDIELAESWARKEAKDVINDIKRHNST